MIFGPRYASTSVLAAMLIAASSACAGETSIIVTVETDLVPDEDFDIVRVRVHGARFVGRRPTEADGDFAIERPASSDGLDFPFSFVLTPRGDRLPEVVIEALDARGRALVSQHATASFRRGHTVVLRMALAADCRFLTNQCLADSTCSGGECVPRDRTGSPLPDITPGRALDGLERPPARDGRHIQRTCRDFGATRGCGVEYLEGGTFAMGDPEAIDASPSLNVTVSPFVIDRYEFTLDRLATYLSDARRLLLTPVVPYPNGDEIALSFAVFDAVSDCTSPALARGESRPVVCRPWDAAAQLCAFEGGRLPTSAEWEFAARHRPVPTLISPRAYPWGTEDPGTAPCERAHYEGCSTSGAVSGVGAFPTTGNIFDLAGNAAEWTADVYATRGLGCFALERLVDPACLPDMRIFTEDVIVRGGGITTVGVPAEVPDRERRSLRGASVAHVPGDSVSPAIGFRCVYDR